VLGVARWYASCVRSAVLVAVVACARSPAPGLELPSFHDRVKVAATCELAAAGVRCHATNPSTTEALSCVEPYLGVRRTGVMYTRSSRTCDLIAAGASVDFDVPVGVAPRDVCLPTLDACRLLVTFDDDPGGARAIAFARELAAGATEQGEHPSWTECDTTRKELLANGTFPGLRKYIEVESTSLYCMTFTRVQFDCVRDAKSETELERCR
jgi:hypothetical protein